MMDEISCNSGADSGEVLFRWHRRTDQASGVSVSGSWCGWANSTPLTIERDVFGRGKLFSGTVSMPYGRHLFRFLVDGEWRHDPQLLTERDDPHGQLCNVVEVTPDSPFRLQLPLKGAPEESAEEAAAETDLINSLREYGLRTDTNKAAKAGWADSYRSSSVATKPSSAADTCSSSSSSSSSAAALAASSGGAPEGLTASSKATVGPGGEGREGVGRVVLVNGAGRRDKDGSEFPTGQQCTRNGGSDVLGKISDSRVETVFGIGGSNGGRVPSGNRKRLGFQEAIEQAAPAASATYRRQEASAAVGACLVTSSVRKDGKLLVAMVGIPARGKTFVARAIARHLDWVGFRSKIFSVGEHRRRELGVWQPTAYFEPGGEGEQSRNRIAAEVLDEALEALKSDIDIAIFDGSNVTRERRKWLSDAVVLSGLHAQVVFIESICNDGALVQSNIQEVRRTSPEYEEKAAEEAEQHYKDRIVEYQRIYEPLEASEGYRFIKLIDVGSQMVTNLISGYIPGRITMLCLNLHLTARPIWMSRHGESEFNMQGRIGGDAPLTSAGKVYAAKLSEFMNRLYPTTATQGKQGEELAVWTSTMLRTAQTVAPMTKDREVIKWSQLSEINAGLMDSLTYEYVAAEMPEEYEARQKDKLSYRYPGGESYQDLFTRLEPVLFEMLRQRTPLLVVGHQAILRVLYGYLTGKSPAECPTLRMPLHTAIKLTPKAYTCEEEWFLPLEECGEPTIDSKHPSSDTHSA